MVTEDDFHGNFSPKVFIEQLSAQLGYVGHEQPESTAPPLTSTGGGGSVSIDDNTTFIVDPLLSLFETTIQQCHALWTDVENKVEVLQERRNEVDVAHSSRLAQLEDDYTTILSDFHNLDERINSVATKAVHIGDELESVSKQGSRVLDAIRLMVYFAEFSYGQPNFINVKRKRSQEMLFVRVKFDTGTSAVAVESFDWSLRELLDVVIRKRHLERNTYTLKLAKDPNAVLNLEVPLRSFTAAEREFTLVQKTPDFGAARKQHHLDIEAKYEIQLSAIFQDDDQVTEAAEIIQKLHLISSELTRDCYDVLRQRIEQKNELIEKKLLDLFDQAHSELDIPQMRKYANTLRIFNGGASCVQLYIGQHRFFFDSSQLAATERSSSEFYFLFHEIVETCRQEHELIHRVFPDPQAVFSQFVQRIFEQRLQCYVEEILEADLQQHGLPAYLVTLALLHTRTQVVVEDIAALDNDDTSPIQKLMNSVFCPFLSRYSEDEETSLEGLYVNYLDEYYLSIHHERRADPTERTSRMRAFIDGKVDQVNEHMVQRTGKTLVESAAKRTAIPDDETFLSVELTLNLIHENREAVVRCSRLSSMAELPNSLFGIFKILVRFLCRDHVEYALDLALANMPLAQDSIRRKPTFRFLRSAQTANYIFHLLQNHFRVAVLPAISIDHSTRVQCIRYKNAVMKDLEIKISDGLDRELCGIIGWVDSLLRTEQKKQDFRSDEPDDFSMMIMCTNACESVCEFLNCALTWISSCLDGRNRDGFLQELGKRFQRILLEHIKRFVYSSEGGVLLSRDLAEYQRLGLKMSTELKEHFELLREIGNIFIVRSENLKQVIAEGHLKNLNQQLLTSYIAKRVDSQSENIVANIEARLNQAFTSRTRSNTRRSFSLS